MAISPPSDIVLDVARAADPTKYRMALEGLQRIGAAAEPDAFADVLNDPAFDVAAASAPVGTPDLRGRLGDGLPAELAVRTSTDTYRRFESFVLQSFIQSLLPKDAEHVFGQGFAGGVWSSMLAEQLARQLAAAGGIGIASAVAAAHPPAEKPPVLSALGASLEFVLAARPDEANGQSAGEI